jgi:thiol-disulfide isomerase/thioredoxin
MNPLEVVAILVGLVALATILGLVWRTRNGHLRLVDGSVVRLAEVPLAGRATLLQFSTQVCAPCVPTRRVLAHIADSTDGVSHVDLDLTHRPDLAARFNILQTPTTLILDRTGAIRARIGGAPRPHEIRLALEGIA